jgi:hypothetical protein
MTPMVRRAKAGSSVKALDRFDVTAVASISKPRITALAVIRDPAQPKISESFTHSISRV